MLTALIVFMLSDYATGIICAVLGKSAKTESGGLSSKVGWEGAVKKVFTLILVALAAQLDALLGNQNQTFQSAVAFYFIAVDGLSILENVSLMGIVPPGILTNALEVMKKKGDATDTEKKE